MMEAVREAVQIQTDRLQDSLQRENNKFLRNIDENMNKIIKGQVKSQADLPQGLNLDNCLPVSLLLQRNLCRLTGVDDQPIVQTSQHPEWFSQPRRPPSPNHDWNKTLPAAQGDAQSWISDLARQTDARSSFNELLDTPIDFSNFIMNRLGTKAEDYGHIKWIEDLVLRAMWIQEPINYDRHTLWGVSYWGRKRQQFYGFVVNRESALDVYYKRRIIAVTELKIMKWHDYKHLDWISIRRDDDKIYKFKEGDFKRLRIQDIEDMLLLLVQGKLSNLTVEERFAFN
nr:hypothetical protein [Tanacetum cinerariifolium]